MEGVPWLRGKGESRAGGGAAVRGHGGSSLVGCYCAAGEEEEAAVY